MLNIHEQTIDQLMQDGKPSDAFFLLCTLSKYLNKLQECWPSNDELFRVLKWGNKRMLNAKKKLYALGIATCTTKRIKGKSRNVYWINPDCVTKYVGVSKQHTLCQNDTPTIEKVPVSKRHTHFMVPASIQHTLCQNDTPTIENEPILILEVPVSFQPVSIQPMSKRHTTYKVLSIDKVLSINKALKKDIDQSKTDHAILQNQIDELKKKLIQAERQNKELRQRLTEQPVKQKKEKKSGLPYLAEYTQVIQMINDICGRKLVTYTDKKDIQQDAKYKAICARIRKGATVQQMEQVIRLKHKEWQNTEYKRYLRPSTLFGGKWSKYLDELQADAQTGTPIADTYNAINEHIHEANLSYEDMLKISNNNQRTQP